MGNNDSYSSPEDSTEEFISPVPIEGSATDPLISKKIGSCTIKRIIGSGGMGTVYEAVQDSQFFSKSLILTAKFLERHIHLLPTHSTVLALCLRHRKNTMKHFLISKRHLK